MTVIAYTRTLLPRMANSTSTLLTDFVAPLSAADVQAALAYFEQHHEEIEQEFQLNQEA